MWRQKINLFPISLLRDCLPWAFHLRNGWVINTVIKWSVSRLCSCYQCQDLVQVISVKTVFKLSVSILSSSLQVISVKTVFNLSVSRLFPSDQCQERFQVISVKTVFKWSVSSVSQSDQCPDCVDMISVKTVLKWLVSTLCLRGRCKHCV